MADTTWHVDIRLTERNGQVTAEARLEGDQGGTAGVGHAGSRTTDLPQDRDYTLAALRALQALSRGLERDPEPGDLCQMERGR